ncbi:AI-2E family transporter [Candidatus Palauibacter sp.]|uniref:AI-2E family transporter n=1 Tax=Candidatus Palauibacter sp. TaxID=3101350 RepID=UPI003B59D74F
MPHPRLMRDDAVRVHRILLNLAAFVIIVAGMRAASALIVSFVLALFLTVLCSTPLRWMTDHKVPKFIAVLSLVLVILAVGTVIGGLLGTRVVELGSTEAQLDRLFAEQVAAIEVSISGWLARFGLQGPELAPGDLLSPSALLGFFRQLVENLGYILANGLLIILTMVFMLLEVSSFPTKMRVAFGEADATEARENFAKVGAAIRRYVLLKTVVSLGTGLTVWALTALLGVSYPVLWGVLAFLLNYVPNIGSFIAAVPPVLIAWLQIGVGTAIATAAGFLVVNVLWANVIEPRWMGYSVGLSTLVVFASLVFWGWVLGPVGMLLSVPLTVMFRIVLGTNESTRWIAVLLGSERSDELTAAIESEVALAMGQSAHTPD